MIRKIIAFFVFGFFVAGPAYSQDTSTREQITTDELQDHLEYLASDELKGRGTGTEEGLQSAEYIRTQMKHAGLTLLGENGFQHFQVVVDAKAGKNNMLTVNGKEYSMEEDFMPYAFSESARLGTDVVFAGYGFDFEKDSISWNSYEGIDADGKWVLILKGDPEPDKDESVFTNFGNERNKVLTATDHGAAGVLFVSGPAFDEKDRLISLYYDKTQSGAGIPVINVKRPLANAILSKKDTDIENLERKIKENMKPFSFAVETNVSASVDIVKEKVDDQNVVAMVEGNDPLLRDRYIVIGAHYDHLGMGGPGSNSRMPDTIAPHNGANDNASGVAGIIEIAERVSVAGNNKRSVVVIAFGAEEMGLIGSKYFTDNPLVELSAIDAMINFDMIGRLDSEEKSISVGGTGTSKESEDILKVLAEDSELKLSFSPEGYGPSDHAAFYAENIPVFFISTGAHKDYHTPMDDVEFINFEGQKMVTDWAYELVMELANRPASLTFQEAGPKQKVGYRNKLKVTLGIMPDFTATEDNGLGVGGVTKGRPADQAGMEKGDLITALDGKPVKNIYDYMNRLKKFEPGQIISVDVLRDGEKKVLIVQL